MKTVAFVMLVTLTACRMQEDQIGGAPAPASFVCDGGKHFAVNYGTDGDSVTLTLATGETVLLLAEPSDRGTRYGWPSDGTGYVFLAEGQTATVLLKDGSQGGLETPLYTACALQ